MRAYSSVLLRMALWIGLVLSIYVVSFLFFYQRYCQIGIRGGNTTIYWTIPNTRLHRILFASYTPLLTLVHRKGLPVDWY